MAPQSHPSGPYKFMGLSVQKSDAHPWLDMRLQMRWKSGILLMWKRTEGAPAIETAKLMVLSKYSECKKEGINRVSA